MSRHYFEILIVLIQEEPEKHYKEISIKVQTLFTMQISEMLPPFHFFTLDLETFDGKSNPRKICLTLS